MNELIKDLGLLINATLIGNSAASSCGSWAPASLSEAELSTLVLRA